MRPALHTPITVLLVASAALTAASCSLVLGIGDPSLDPTGGTGGTGGKGGSGGATEATTASGSSATGGGTGGGGGAEMTYPCTPSDPGCKEIKSDCLAIYDNKGRDKFALRFSEIAFLKPDIFSAASVQPNLDLAVTMNLPECKLNGWGTLSWILELNPGPSSSFRFGAAKPPSDPHDGYNFINETVTQNGQVYNVAPAVGSPLVIPDGGGVVASQIDTVVLPVYLNDPMGNTFLMPLHAIYFDPGATKISGDYNCIGHYNAEGLQPSNGCFPSTAQNRPRFITGGRFRAYILLEEADKIIVDSSGFNRSLCAMLTSSSTFETGGNPSKCKRTSGKIVFHGDWCSEGNSYSSATCYDAMQVDVKFAASGVALNN